MLKDNRCTVRANAQADAQPERMVSCGRNASFAPSCRTRHAGIRSGRSHPLINQVSEDTEMAEVIEYRVRVVQRYVITRYQDDGKGSGGSEALGEFDNWERAINIAKRLADTDLTARFVYVDEGSVLAELSEHQKASNERLAPHGLFDNRGSRK